MDFARKHLSDNIYKQAVLEGITTTYADTENIIEGGKVSNMTANDIMKVINLKNAWEFILNQADITSPTNFSLLCEINKLIEEVLLQRESPVLYSGQYWWHHVETQTTSWKHDSRIVKNHSRIKSWYSRLSRRTIVVRNE